MMDKKELIVTRAGRFFHEGDLVNLGIGMPTQVVNHLPEGVEILLQSENGFWALAPLPHPARRRRTWSTPAASR